MVERLKGRIADLLGTHPFRSGEDLEQTLRRLSGSTTTTCRTSHWIVSARHTPRGAGNAHIQHCFLNGRSIARDATGTNHRRITVRKRFDLRAARRHIMVPPSITQGTPSLEEKSS